MENNIINKYEEALECPNCVLGLNCKTCKKKQIIEQALKENAQLKVKISSKNTLLEAWKKLIEDLKKENEELKERIANVKHYIEFNEREDDKDFFAHKELELYKKAQKYIELTDELGCPLEVLFKLGELEKNGEVIFIKGKAPSEFETFETDDFHVDFSHKRIIVFVEKTDWTDTRVFYFKDYKKTWWLSETKEE